VVGAHDLNAELELAGDLDRPGAVLVAEGGGNLDLVVAELVVLAVADVPSSAAVAMRSPIAAMALVGVVAVVAVAGVLAVVADRRGGTGRRSRWWRWSAWSRWPGCENLRASAAHPGAFVSWRVWTPS
jgi:hypothetical protein